MEIKFREDDTLVICAENTVEVLALKYWLKEYAAHGNKVLDIDLTLNNTLPNNIKPY